MTGLPLPHLLMSQRHETPMPPPRFALTHDDADGNSFPCLPHELMKEKKNKILNRHLIQHPCLISLNSHYLSPPSSDRGPTVYINFHLYDFTKVILPSASPGPDYAFPHPLNDKPFRVRFPFRPSHFSSLAACLHIAHTMIPPDFPMGIKYRGFFELEMSSFLYEVAGERKSNQFDVEVMILAFTAMKVGYEHTVEFAKEMEVITDGRWRDKDEEEGGTEKEERPCPVCFEEIETRWSESVRLFCRHEFHGKCIAPWLMRNNTCPMCRCEQV